jgi:hypothetical protein
MLAVWLAVASRPARRGLPPVPAGAAVPGEPGSCAASACSTRLRSRVRGRDGRSCGTPGRWTASAERAAGRAPDARRGDRSPPGCAGPAGQPSGLAHRVWAVACVRVVTDPECRALPGWKACSAAGPRPSPRGSGPCHVAARSMPGAGGCPRPAAWVRCVASWMGYSVKTRNLAAADAGPRVICEAAPDQHTAPEPLLAAVRDVQGGVCPLTPP